VKAWVVLRVCLVIIIWKGGLGFVAEVWVGKGVFVGRAYAMVSTTKRKSSDRFIIDERTKGIFTT
jgi:hypothetical protein